MIRVQTASRLHFGLLNVGGPEDDRQLLEKDSPRGRLFGGVGLMIQPPGVRIALTPAATWTAEGPLAERALGYAELVQQQCPALDLPPQHLRVEAVAGEHLGLGTGTQLGLAVALAMLRAAGKADIDARTLASLVGRGRRSAIGVHGFCQGGFLVDGGKRRQDSLAPLIYRHSFPDEWRIVLVTPAQALGLHGQAERDAFQRLGNQQGRKAANTLCRLVLLGLLPALEEADWQEFSHALYEFNARAGEAFAPTQGGTYASASIARRVSWFREQGIPGCGQSSWGPAVFAIARDPEQAADVAARAQACLDLRPDEIRVTAAANQGATIEVA